MDILTMMPSMLAARQAPRQLTGTFVVLAWNDLGMHCLNPTYDQAVILPPYNTIHAQVIQIGDPPRIVTNGVSVSYSLTGNTYSYGKRAYGGFWDNMLALFGVSLPHDRGLNLWRSDVSNGLAGTMLLDVDDFRADGIPVTPVSDDGTFNPYQEAVVTVRDGQGTVLAETRCTVPTSDEINCSKVGCHGADAFRDLMAKHDARQGTALAASAPVRCSSCHGSPILGAAAPLQPGIKYLSEAIHGFHAVNAATIACYDCHPGQTARCNRSIPHDPLNQSGVDDGACVNCHGPISKVASDIASGAKTPWVTEPACADCHTGVPDVATEGLYRDAKGHGGLRCVVCHHSPHAVIPSRVSLDNAQAVRLQGAAVPLGSCGACHSSSRGGGEVGEFAGEHAGPNPERKTACNVCHTNVSTNTAAWPHSFGWKARAGAGTVGGG